MNKQQKLICGAIMELEVGTVSASNLWLGLNGEVAKNLLFQVLCLDDDEHVRMPGFYETWIDKYLEVDFFKHFRMQRSTFNQLIILMSEHFSSARYYASNRSIPAEKMLLASLWYLAKGCTLETVSERFDICAKSVFCSISTVLNILNLMSPSIIKWPSQRESVLIERQFKRIAHFPGIIGSIDGCHFQCKVPVQQQDSYQDRHCQHSITMQAICLPNLIFTNISAGYPGSLHDARILRESNIYKKIELYGEETVFYNSSYHLVGDSAYPCKQWLMKPYRNANTRVEKQFNKALSKSRVVIEHAFGVLKGRWKILKYLNVYSIERATKIVVACSVLHNHCLSNKDIYEIDNSEEEANEENYVVEDNQEGNIKRDQIALLLPN